MLITDFFQAFKQGKQIANPATWKNASLATSALVTFLTAVVGIAKGLGYDIHLDDQTLQAAGAGIFALYGVFSAVVTVVTSTKVGLPSADPSEPLPNIDALGGPSSGPG
jgi:hypothetical protein